MNEPINLDTLRLELGRKFRAATLTLNEAETVIDNLCHLLIQRDNKIKELESAQAVESKKEPL